MELYAAKGCYQVICDSGSRRKEGSRQADTHTHTPTDKRELICCRNYMITGCEVESTALFPAFSDILTAFSDSLISHITSHSLTWLSHMCNCIDPYRCWRELEKSLDIHVRTPQIHRQNPECSSNSLSTHLREKEIHIQQSSGNIRQRR